jgi:thiazole/oxazole-forming peptide maturase SagC family component
MLKDYDVFFDESNSCYQVRSKTNSFALEFDSDATNEVFKELVSINKEKDTTLLSTYNQLIKSGFLKEHVIEVLNGLNEYGIIPLYEVMESGIEFNSNNTTSNYTGNYLKAETSSILIVGESELSKVLLKEFGVYTFKTLEHKTYVHLLSSIAKGNDKFIEEIREYDFIVVDANQWNPYFMNVFNETMVKLQKPWLYIGGVEEASIKVGPIFFGRETGCYNCMLKRLKSNNEYANYFETYENYLKSKQISSKSDQLPHMPVLYNLISNYALLEILKFLEGWAVPILWKGLLTINIFNYETEKHTLLKVPYCEVCKPNVKYNIAPWLESITLK